MDDSWRLFHGSLEYCSGHPERMRTADIAHQTALLPYCCAAVTSYRIVGVPESGVGTSITQSGKGVPGTSNQVGIDAR